MSDSIFKVSSRSLSLAFRFSNSLESTGGTPCRGHDHVHHMHSCAFTIRSLSFTFVSHNRLKKKKCFRKGGSAARGKLPWSERGKRCARLDTCRAGALPFVRVSPSRDIGRIFSYHDSYLPVLHSRSHAKCPHS